MLRLCVASRVGISAHARHQLCRVGQPTGLQTSRGAATQQQGGGSGLKILGGSLVALTAGVGGTLGYASYDQTFREDLQKQVPGSDQVLDLILGPMTPLPPPAPKPAPKPISKLKIPSSIVVTPPKSDEKVESVVQPPVTKANRVDEVKVEEPKPAVQPNVEESKPIEEPSVNEPPPVVEPAVEEIKPLLVPAPPSEPSPVSAETQPEVTSVETVVAAENVVAASEDAKEAVMEPVVEAVVETIISEEVQTKPDVVEEKVVVVDVIPVPELETIISPEDVKEIETPTEMPIPEVVVPIESEEQNVENTALNAVLDEVMKEMKASVEKAVAGYETSTNTMMNHVSLMHEVLESDIAVTDNSAWNRLYEAALNKTDAAKAAEIREKEAIAAIDNVIETISSAKKDVETADNPELKAAEEAVQKAIYHLDQAKVKGTAVENEAKVMEEYRNLVDAGRKQFHKEMASIMPDVKLGEQTGRLTEEELNMFISHAYRKVLFLQKQLARQQTVEQEAFKRAVVQHREEIGREAALKVEAEVSQAREDLEARSLERLEQLQAEAEQELRSQLRRQAAAHSDHIQDVVKVREGELSRLHSAELSGAVGELSSSYQQSLAELAGSVQGLKHALELRAGSDQTSRQSMSLFAAVSGLREGVEQGGGVSTQVESIKAVVGPEGDSFVSALLSSLSPTALDRGVATQEDLVIRFSRVQEVAKRVAAVGDEGGSLLKYGLSYLQSVILLDREPRGVTDKVTCPRALLRLTAQHLEAGDLAGAVQLATSLGGEAGKVARDWLQEARLTLETRQLVEALASYAQAQNLESLPQL